ncbi:Sporulation domain protein [Candidatus Accumulibacter aalborgensis]|uniref:Sporulation domain protein n=1 Tax=Candidatus Accumulibacter aalborgensis TaxID=1860102 RepID=A0A1A8XQ74_9PROT|nr:SPOR domain-containing protein [Candidatus Accumulibacter aalborgensis]SBT06602.1 Sporulation domain protein [Candidatus Accumulibacter aalborgensis]
MTESSDPQLQLKKRARRRLVGAVALAGLAAVILPMAMDEEPKPTVQEVLIRIPGQDPPPLKARDLAAKSPSSAPVAPVASVEPPPEAIVSSDAPQKPPAVVPVAKPAVGTAARPTEKAGDQTAERKLVKPAEKVPEKAVDKKIVKPVEKLPEKAAEAKPTQPADKVPEKPVARKVEKAADKAPEKPAAKKVEKPVEKAPEKPVAKKVEKPAEKSPDKAPVKKADQPAEKPAEKAVDKQADKPVETPTPQAAEKPAEETGKPAADDPPRTNAHPAGKPVAAAAPPKGGRGQHVIVIGAFANPDNAKQLQSKIGGLGVNTYTEVLSSPDGTKTRVRAGPFPTREAAEKALEKLQRSGVNGVVAGRQ